MYIIYPIDTETVRDRTMVLLPFVMSSIFMIKDVSSRRKKSFKKCPDERALVDWASFLHTKNLSDLTGKIKEKCGLPATCNFLLKNFDRLQHFLGTFFLINKV